MSGEKLRLGPLEKEYLLELLDGAGFENVMGRLQWDIEMSNGVRIDWRCLQRLGKKGLVSAGAAGRFGDFYATPLLTEKGREVAKDLDAEEIANRSN